MTRGIRASQRGFTLIEIMVVVVIIGLLTAAVTTAVFRNVDQARATRVRQDIQAIETALQMYRLDNSRFPSTEQGLAALLQKPTTEPIPPNWKEGGYLTRPAVDPWKNEYIYLSPGEVRDYDLISYGADGREGGEGTDADISNSNLDQ